MDAVQKLKDDDLIESNGMATLGGLDRKGLPEQVIQAKS